MDDTVENLIDKQKKEMLKVVNDISSGAASDMTIEELNEYLGDGKQVLAYLKTG